MGKSERSERSEEPGDRERPRPRLTTGGHHHEVHREGRHLHREEGMRHPHGHPRQNRHPLQSYIACRAARGTYNTDYAGVEDFMRHEKDVGSSEYQIARISTRIKQLTEHLKEHKTDHATRRGLMSLLNKRNTLLKYLFNNDRKTYTATIESLGIRSR